MTAQDTDDMTWAEYKHGRPVDLGDPRVARAVMTDPAMPEQYEGQLADGRWFYFRYRWGWAYVGVGDTLDAAVDSDRYWKTYGGEYDGEWTDEATRNAAFAELLTGTLEGWVRP